MEHATMGMSRHRAAALHLGLSATIVGGALVILLPLWYPGAWFDAMGGKHLILILAAVDIVLGPTLTWIVFRAGKPGMKFDIVVIACLQIGAFLYGLHVLYVARPAFMVLVVDQFRAVTAAELDAAALAQSPHAEFRQPPFAGPLVVGSAVPHDPRERQDLMMLSVGTGIDLHQLPRYWQPYAGAAALKASAPLQDLRALAPGNGQVIDDFLAAHQLPADTLRFVPLRTRFKEMAALVDAQSGAVVGVIDAQPWK
jgi:hypothetical protein